MWWLTSPFLVILLLFLPAGISLGMGLSLSTPQIMIEKHEARLPQVMLRVGSVLAYFYISAFAKKMWLLVQGGEVCFVGDFSVSREMRIRTILLSC